MASCSSNALERSAHAIDAVSKDYSALNIHILVGGNKNKHTTIRQELSPLAAGVKGVTEMQSDLAKPTYVCFPNVDGPGVFLVRNNI